ncbi:Ribonuclease H-like superfamily, partial [Arabidopsis suecica]
LQVNTPLYCCTDGSWSNSTSFAGIGWALYNAMGQCLLQGSSSIEPTNSVLETEAIALKEALLQIKRLNYRGVTFCGDSLTLYSYLEKAVQQYHPSPGCLEIQSYLEDIMFLNHGQYHFKYICRADNTLADKLAKEARAKNSPYVVSWVT